MNPIDSEYLNLLERMMNFAYQRREHFWALAKANDDTVAGGYHDANRAEAWAKVYLLCANEILRIERSQ